MRVHSDSSGLDPAELHPGEDIVLHLDEAHGVALEEGVLAHDHLDLDERRAIDGLVVDALARWRAGHDEALTVDGVCLPWIWERDLLAFTFMPTIATAVALDRAVERLAPTSLTVMDRDGLTEQIAAAVAHRRGIELVSGPAARVRAAPTVDRTLNAPRQPVRRRAFRAFAGIGIPSRPRHDSVLFMSYWPLVPLLDRMLEGDGRPAIWLERLPASPRRSLRAVRQGGWVGRAGPLTRARGARAARRALKRAGEAPPLQVAGLELGDCLHRQALATGDRRAASDLAHATLLRRVLRSGRISTVLVPYDVEPTMRLVVSLAREAGVRTLLVAHGAYPLRHTIVDMTVSDEVALWSTAFGPTVWSFDRPLHVVGYPLPHRPVPARRLADGSDRPRVLVLGRGKETQTALFDDRYLMRHYRTSVLAVTAAFPGARIVLRPAPAESADAAPEIVRSHPGIEIEIDRDSEVTDALERSDLCLGVPSTATFQAALTGTPVIVVNLSGYEWCWPLGGITDVPIARSTAALEGLLRGWREERELPGQQTLLDALGANGRDATGALLELLGSPAG